MTSSSAAVPLTTAVVQLSSQDDVAQNLERVAHWVREAAKAGAKLVALPENFALLGDETQKRAAAEDLDAAPQGPIVTTLARLAGEHGVYLVGGGMPEKSPDAERPYNTSVLFAPTGKLLARYRKIHLFDVDLDDGTKLEESRATARGEVKIEAPTPLALAPSSDPVFLGMTVCYDVRFPEVYRALTTLGARIITVPAAFTVTTGKDHWHVLLRARAIENQVFIVAPAQVGKHPRGRQTYGKSLIADPWGDVLAQCGEGEGFALAQLDFKAQDRVRRALPCLSHRLLK